MTSSTYRKIGTAAIIMMTSIFLSRVMGTLRELILAALGGAGVEMDAYKVAFVLPEILNHVLASGFLSITFIPIFSRYLADGDENEGWRVFSIILTLFGLLMALMILAATLLAPWIVPLLAPGRDDPLFLSMAVRMTRIILPAQLFFFAGGLFMAVQFARERFLLPALSPLIYNLAIMLGGIFLSRRIGVESFSWGALTGAFLGSFVLQGWGAVRAGLRYRPCFEYRHPDLRRYILLTLPLMLGLTMIFSTEIFSKIFGSFLPAGAISWIDFALRIVMMLVGFFGQAVGVAAYPFLARLAAENKFDEMNRLFNDALRFLSMVIPVSVLFFVLRHEIVRILFEHLRFKATDTQMTALALAGMLVGTVAFTAQTVVNRGFYAMQNTLTPAIFGTIAVVFSLPLYWIGVKTLGVLGVALAVSLSALIQVLVLYQVWNRRSANSGSRQVYRFYLKILLLCLPLGVVLTVGHRLLLRTIDVSSFMGSVGVAVLLGLLFCFTLALLSWLFKIEEVRVLWRKLVERVPGRARG